MKAILGIAVFLVAAVCVAIAWARHERELLDNPNEYEGERRGE